ncbi:hypothetical protein ACP70R_040885 [Stipagrostis hirtigluma subsp. patula]
MATTTDAADRVAPVEEPEEEPKKVEAAAEGKEEEEEPKKVEAAAEAGEEEEEEERPKKVEAGGDAEEVRLEGKGAGFGGPEAENGEVEGDGGGGSLDGAEAEEEGGGAGEVAAENGDASAASVVTPASVAAVEAESENGELGEEGASPAPPDAQGGEEKGELGEEGGAAVAVEGMDKVADEAESAGAEKEKPGDEEIGSGGGDDGELVGENKVKQSAVSLEKMEVAEPEDKVAPEAEANGELGDEKETSAETVAAGGEEAPAESLEEVAHVQEEAAEPEPVSEASPVVINDGSADKLAPTSEDSVPEGSTEKGQNAEDLEGSTEKEQNAEDLEGSTEKEQNAEDLEESTEKGQDANNLEGSTEKGQNAEDQGVDSEAVEDASFEKPTEVETVAADTDSILSREFAPESIQENSGGEQTEGATAVVNHKEEAGDDDIVEAAAEDDIVEATADDEDAGGDEADEDDDDGVNSDHSPARVAILESSEAAKQIMKELAEGSSSGSVSGSRDYTNSMDGQIMLDDSEEEDDDDDNDDGDEKGFDSAALAALLKAATGASSDGNITVGSQDGSRIFSMDRPAGLGSSAPSLRPTAPRQPARSNLFSPSELAVTADPTEEMTEEEKKLHEKVELIRVKFLRLVYRLGATPEETVAAQVLYRLSLAEGIRHGRQTNRAFSLDNARKKALLLEAEGKDDLNFSCNILVLGKTGVGKSATINSIFGEQKSKTDAFGSATTSVREIVGDVDGVKIRIIDTPGLRPNVMDQGSNRKILSAVKKYTKRCPPDIVLYVDRMDSLSRDLNDLPLLKTITAVLGSSIWFNAIVALTHAASAPPEGLNGAPMTYEVLMAQRSHIIQQSIRQAAGDMRLMNPVALVENHPSCRRNREGQKVLPNGQSWRHQMLLLCYSSKILSEANSLLKLQDPNPGKLFGFRFRSPPLPFLLSSLLQSRAHPKLSADQGGNDGDSDIDLDDYSDIEQDDDEEEYDQLPPFKPLTKAQLARLTKEQKNAYFDEYDYRVKLLQKKQWKDELRRLKEMKKRGKTDMDDYGYANIAGENDQDPPPENVSVPLPDMVLPPSFDCDNPTYRYRFLEPTSTVLARPVLDAHGWDHDCGYDGVSVEETLALLNRFPANVAVQVTKDKKEFSIHLDSSIAAKHGENASSLAGFDIQTVGRQLAYILRGETKIKNIKKNKTTGGFSVTFLGDIVATGLKVEDQLSLGKRLALVASTGAMRAQGDTAYGANLEARLKDKDYPIGQSLSTLGLSLMKWRRDLALGANLQSQFSIGRGSKMAVRLGLNNKLSGQITVRTSTSEQVQIALLGLVPVAASIYRSFRPSEPSFAY